MVSRIDRLLRTGLRSLTAYAVPSSEGLIKLDAMENPFSLPDASKSEWLRMLADAQLNRYPNASAAELKQSIRTVLQLPEQCELLLGNGSDELIQLLCLAIIETPGRLSGKPIIMAAEPGFAMYRYTAMATGLDFVGVPLQKDDFSLDMPAMLQAIEQHRPEILYLAYPNNPTGNLYHWSDCRELIENVPGLVVFDEAYHPFSDATAVSALAEYEHVLLLRTFSKLGLAGIRLGVLAGAPLWLRQLEKIRLPYNINTLTQITAEFACRHYQLFLRQAAQVCQQRSWIMDKLNEFPALQVFESRANFVLFRIINGDADTVFNGLLENGILIKNLNNSHPMLRGCLRVTVGTPEENEIFIVSLKRLMSI